MNGREPMLAASTHTGLRFITSNPFDLWLSAPTWLTFATEQTALCRLPQVINRAYARFGLVVFKTNCLKNSGAQATILLMTLARFETGDARLNF